MSDDEVKGLLFAYPAEPLAYDDWLKVGQALHHQYMGGDVGFDLWVAWSALSSKHDFSKMRKKYDSFGRWKGARVTMASVCWHVNQQGGVVDSPCVFDVVSDESDDDDFTRDLPLNMSDDEVKGLSLPKVTGF